MVGVELSGALRTESGARVQAGAMTMLRRTKTYAQTAVKRCACRRLHPSTESQNRRRTAMRAGLGTGAVVCKARLSRLGCRC